MNRMNTGNGSREPACWSETADWSGCGMRTSSSSASAASATSTIASSQPKPETGG